MALIELNTDPSERQLRQFGGVCLVALPLLSWFWTSDLTVTLVAAVIGALLGVTGLVAPRWLKPVFVGLSIVTIPIGLVVGELVMLLIYFGLFLPLAILFRILGRDALSRRSGDDARTFWHKRSAPENVRRYYQQW